MIRLAMGIRENSASSCTAGSTYPPKGIGASQYSVSPHFQPKSLGPKPIEKRATGMPIHLAASRWPNSWIRIRKPMANAMSK